MGNGKGSKFSLSEPQIKELLSNSDVIRAPVTRKLESPTGTNYVRQLDVGRVIGRDRYDNNNETSTLTVITNWQGDLVTAFPGILQ
jgi:filamentous hemagglutinin